MARLNIEDEWFDDPRRQVLVDRIGVAADGVAVRMWRLAQTFYRAGTLVPPSLFELVPHWKEFEEVGLAIRHDDGVYIKGGAAKFAWLERRKEAGAKGGKTPKKTSDAHSKQTKAKAGKEIQNEPSYSSSLSFSLSSSSSPSISGSNSEEQNKDFPTGSKASPSVATWEAYSEAYETRYKTKPVRNATVNTQIKNFVGRIPGEEAPQVARFYVFHNDRFYVNAMHPVGLLLRDAEKLRTEWATGRQMTGAAARQVEQTQNNLSVLESVRADMRRGRERERDGNA